MKRTKKVKIYAIGLVLGLILMLDVVLALPWGVFCTTSYTRGARYDGGAYYYACHMEMVCDDARFNRSEDIATAPGTGHGYASLSWCN